MSPLLHRAVRTVCAALLLVATALPLHAAQTEDLAWAREAIARGRYSEGLEWLDTLLAGKGLTVYRKREAGALRVRALYETGQLKLAAKVAEKLATDHPAAAAVQALYAEMLLESGRHKAAGKLLKAQLARHAKHVRTRLLAYELARVTGNDPWAEKQVDFFFNLYNEGDPDSLTAEVLTAVARAIEVEAPHDAWRAYQEAQQADAEYLEAYVRGGFLCLDKYSWGFAKEQFETALKRNGNLAVAHAGLAAALLAKSKYDDAEKRIEKALKINPTLSLALELKAILLAMDHKRDESLKFIKMILKGNANSIEGLSLLAAHHEARDDAKAREKTIARIHKIDAHNADVYITLANAAERLRQFPAAVVWAEKAIAADPEDFNGYYLAGMNLLRIGEEARGYRILEKAFELNGFNIWARNMLQVLDKDVKRKRFVYHKTKHFFVKLEQTEDEILWPYLEIALEQAYAKYAGKYRIKPVGPKQFDRRILFLMFPKHEDFSARTTGLPGLGALGACFGQVITMPSPRYGKQRPGGSFNWKRVLEHEFIHVLTLQRTRYRIPRWFTEGLSTWEEQDPQIKWDRMLVAALKRKQLLPLEDINVGFTRPKFPQQVLLSYYHASLVCEYLAETHGFKAIDRMLKMYAEGKQTTEVLPAVTGKDMKTLNKEVLDHVKKHASRIKVSAPVNRVELAELEEKVAADPKNAKLLVQLAAGQFANRQVDAARESATRAIQNDPDLVRAYGILGFIAYEIDEDFREARKRFTEAKQADPTYFLARLFLGVLANKDENTDEAIGELEAARKIYPRYAHKENNPHFLLADIYEKQKKLARAIGVMRDWVRVDNTSYKGFKRLAGMLVKAKRHGEAADAYLEAIFIDPFELEVHIEAGKAYEKAARHAEAAREYGVATALDSHSLPALVGHARALIASGQMRKARKAISAVLALDPENAEALALQRSWQ